MDKKQFKELKSRGKKKCTQCNEIKQLGDFYFMQKNTVSSKCVECHKQYSKGRKKIRKTKEYGTKWLMSLRDNGTKRCYSCLEILPFDKFGKLKNSFDGHQRACKVCKSKIDKGYRDNHKNRQVLLDFFKQQQ